MAVVISLVTVIIPDLIIYNDMDVGHLIFSFVIISIALNMIFFYINRKILKLYPKVDSEKKTKKLYINVYNYFNSFLYCIDEINNRIKKQDKLIKDYSELNNKLSKMRKAKDVILDISNSAIKMDNPENFFDYILENGINLIESANKGSLLVLNDENMLEVKSSKGYDKKVLSNIKLKFKETYFKDKLGKSQIKVPMRIENISEFNKDSMSKENYELLKKAGGLDIKTTISCSIIVDEKFYGLLNIDSHSKDAFNQDDIFLIRYFSIEIENAIKNYQLIREKLYLSRHDKLTGLYNRHYFKERLVDILDKTDRYNQDFSLVVFDLNNFKNINDTYGHSIGDEIIKAFANKLKNTFRKSDLIARYGGDEFIGIFFETDKENIEKRISQMAFELETEPINIENNKLKISTSYGVAYYPSDAKDLEELFKVADKRMYEFKEKFKNN